MLKDELMQDLKDAMKEKDTIKKDTVQMVRAAILQFEKDKGEQVDDNKIIEIIAKEVKGKKDALVEFEKSGRQDLIVSCASLTRNVLIIKIRNKANCTTSNC